MNTFDFLHIILKEIIKFLKNTVFQEERFRRIFLIVALLKIMIHIVLRTRQFDRHLRYFLMKVCASTWHKAKECVFSSGVEGLLNFLFSIKTY